MSSGPSLSQQIQGKEQNEDKTGFITFCCCNNNLHKHSVLQPCQWILSQFCGSGVQGALPGLRFRGRQDLIGGSGEKPFLGTFRCSCQTEVPASQWLSAGSCSQLLEATHILGSGAHLPPKQQLQMELFSHGLTPAVFNASLPLSQGKHLCFKGMVKLGYIYLDKPG